MVFFHSQSGVGKCPNVSRHPTIGDISSPTDFWFGDVKQIPNSRDINPNPCQSQIDFSRPGQPSAALSSRLFRAFFSPPLARKAFMSSSYLALAFRYFSSWWCFAKLRLQYYIMHMYKHINICVLIFLSIHLLLYLYLSIYFCIHVCIYIYVCVRVNYYRCTCRDIQ